MLTLTNRETLLQNFFDWLLVKIKSSSEKVFKYFLMGNSPKSLEKGIKIPKWSSHEIVGFLSKLLSECQKCHLREPIIQKFSWGPCLRTPLGWCALRRVWVPFITFCPPQGKILKKGTALSIERHDSLLWSSSARNEHDNKCCYRFPLRTPWAHNNWMESPNIFAS